MNILSNIVKKQCDKEYERERERQNCSYEDWKKEQPGLTLEPQLLEAAVLYGDYEKQGPQGGRTPVFLPDFSPNRWDYEDYLGQAVYIKQAYYEQIDWEKTSRRAGLNRIIQSAFATQGMEAVRHIRGMLTEAPAGYVQLKKRPTPGAFEETDMEAVNRVAEQGLSVIIPSRDNPEILRKCLKSLVKTTGNVSFEILIVDNGSYPENRLQVEAMCRSVTQESDRRIDCRYYREEMAFDFSKMCNMGAEMTKGQTLLFLNDDIEAVEAGWLTDMLMQISKPYTGAVGMKLLYPDGERIQHAGIVNLPMGPVHKLQFASDKEVYYDRRNRGVHNVCAVTGACLMMRRELFERLGGMWEALPVAFNDVELCFHASEEGYYNVVCCDHYLLHHESISRGQDTTEEKRSRLLRERARLYERHPKMHSFDAFYPYDNSTGYGLCHAYLDTAIRPAYEDGKARVQFVKKWTKTACDKLDGVLTQKPEHEKLNTCLKFEVEQLYADSGRQLHIAGRAFVVGSDNAQFVYQLVLRGEKEAYITALEPMLRRDLEKNMPDQIHVGLSGFHILADTQALEKGRYRVEIYAKDKCSSLRLKQRSNVFLNL